MCRESSKVEHCGHLHRLYYQPMASVVVQPHGYYLQVQRWVLGNRAKGHLGDATFERQELSLVMRTSFREYA